MKTNRLILLTLFIFLSLPVFSEQISLPPYDQVLKSNFKSPVSDKKDVNVHNNTLLKNLSTLEQISPVKMSNALYAIALFSEASDYSGRGDVNYWLRVTEDFTRLARALGTVYSKLSHHISNKATKAAINQIGVDLQNIEPGDIGNVEYWKNRAEFVGEEISNKSIQIVRLSAKLNEDSIDLKSILLSMGLVLTSFDFSGNGNAQYWMRVATNIDLLAKSGVKAVSELSKTVDADVASILISYAYQLNDISSEGRGDVNFWRDKTVALASQLDKVGTGLIAVGRSL